MAPNEALTAWLEGFLSANGGIAGSVHTRDAEELVLRATKNIPPKVAEITARIPYGKGMAGLAWERNRAVATCNLKTDQSGDVRPGARAVDAQAAVAIPVRDSSGSVRAVVGIAFSTERDFDDSALDRLEQAAAALP